MSKVGKALLAAILFTGGLLSFVHGPAAAAINIDGRVDVGGGPLASSTVTLWVASASAPKQLAQTQTGADGRFVVSIDQPPGGDTRACTWLPKVAYPRSPRAVATIRP
jgi:hypothetical protein